MTGAGEALQATVIAALRQIVSLGVYEGPPVQAAFPYAMVEVGPETDWSHKTGEGRSVRLAVIIKDKGERPVRLRALAGEAEELLSVLGGEMEGWQLVTMGFVRGRLVRDAGGVWATTMEYRALMLRATP